MRNSASGPSTVGHSAPGIGLIVLAVAFFAVMNVFIKHLSATYPTMQIVFFRNLLAFVPLLPFLMHAGGIAALRTRRPLGHAFRSLVGLAAMAGFFYAYGRLPLADVVSIAFAAPLFMTALSVPLLKETVGVRRWSAVVIGFIGVLIMVKPGSGVFEPAALVALVAAFGVALVFISIRSLSATEGSATIVFYFTLFGTVVSGAFLPWHWAAPDAWGLLLLCIVGLLGGAAQMCMTNALKLAPVAVVAPFEYTSLLWAVGFDLALWGRAPARNTLVGAALIVATGLYILHREAVIARRRASAAPTAGSRTSEK
jgi:drug/metabolite transporter (DMT)-like permease